MQKHFTIGLYFIFSIPCIIIQFLLNNILTSCILSLRARIPPALPQMQDAKIFSSNRFIQQQLMYFLMMDL